MFKDILLAYDGSDHADHALEVAATLAKTTNGRITVVHAFDPIPVWALSPDVSMSLPAVERRLADSETILNTAQQRLSGLGITVIEQDMLEGPPAEAILQAATVLRPDVVVMGSRGLGVVQGLLLGSVSERVVSAAPCPVLVVR